MLAQLAWRDAIDNSILDEMIGATRSSLINRFSTTAAVFQHSLNSQISCPLREMSNLNKCPIKPKSNIRWYSKFRSSAYHDEVNIQQIRLEFGTKFSDGSFRLEKDSTTGIATLCICNRPKKNCFSGYMMAQFADILDELEQWKEAKAVVLYGDEGFFSSGGDLDTVRQIANREGGRKMITLMQYNLDRLQSLPIITVAYIRGMALGGGAEIATACDYRLATPEAVIGFVQVRVGICTVWGGGSRLVQLLGYSKALDLLATGRIITAVEAEKLGFVNRVMTEESCHTDEREQIVASARQFLNPFIQHPRSTMLISKQIANDARNCDTIHQALAIEMEHGLKIWGGPVHQLALAKKVNHIKPNN